METETDAGHGKMKVTLPQSGVQVTSQRILFACDFHFRFLDAVWFFFVIDAE